MCCIIQFSWYICGHSVSIHGHVMQVHLITTKYECSESDVDSTHVTCMTLCISIMAVYFDMYVHAMSCVSAIAQ